MGNAIKEKLKMATISILIYIKRNIKQMIKCYVLEIVDDNDLSYRYIFVVVCAPTKKFLFCLSFEVKMCILFPFRRVFIALCDRRREKRYLTETKAK